MATTHINTILDIQTKRAQQYTTILNQLATTITTKEVDALNALCVESIKLFNTYSTTLRTLQKATLLPYLNTPPDEATVESRVGAQCSGWIDEIQQFEQQRLKAVVNYLQQQLQTLHPPECSHGPHGHHHHEHTDGADKQKEHCNHGGHHDNTPPDVTLHTPQTFENWRDELFKQYLHEEWVDAPKDQPLQQYVEFLEQQQAQHNKNFHNQVYAHHDIIKLLEDDTNTDYAQKDALLNKLSQQIQNNVEDFEEQMAQQRKQNKVQFLHNLEQIDEMIAEVVEELYAELLELIPDSEDESGVSIWGVFWSTINNNIK